MEQSNKKGWYNALHLGRRLYYTLINYRLRSKNPDFKEFSLLEYSKISPVEVNDFKRLNFIKQLDLEQKGYIDKDLKKLLTYFKEKKRLVKSRPQGTSHWLLESF